MHLNTLLLVSTGFGCVRAAILTNKHFLGITAGQPFDITFTKADGPVTIELMSGDTYNLQIAQTLATDVSGEHFSWVPTGQLCVNYYSLRITDKSGIPNYSASFPLTLDHKFTADGGCSKGTVAVAATAAPTLALRDDMITSTSLIPSSTMVLRTKTFLRKGFTSIVTRTIFVPAIATTVYIHPDHISGAGAGSALRNDAVAGGVVGLLLTLGVGFFGFLFV